MNYQQETGIIISPTKDIIHITDGFPGHVVFPRDLLWALHLQSKGCIYAFAHTHPDGHTNLSLEDETTLRALSQAFSPFPVRLITVARIERFNVEQQTADRFQTTTYLGMYQAKDDWIAKGKQGAREFYIIREKEKVYDYPFVANSYGNRPPKIATWERVIIEASFTT